MPSDKKDVILKKVLKRITPNKNEEKRVKTFAEKVLIIVNEKALKHGAYAIIAGSLTRDTWLPEKEEFDVFILFPTHVDKEKMEKLGLKIGKNTIKELKGEYVVEYAEHPYVSGVVKSTHMDIVPCYEIKSTEQLKTSVDRTPFHVRYIEKNLPREISNEVRLLKKFCKSNGIYGADAKTEGFSGYVCEILTIAYGSFTGVLEAAMGWHPGEVVDIENHYKKDQYDELRQKFSKQPMIIIDPTDEKRNAGAAISVRSFQKIRSISRKFMESPSIEAFFPKKKKPLNLSELKEIRNRRETDIIVLTFKPPKVVPDVLWPQLRRFAERMEGILKEHEFITMRHGVYTDEERFAAVIFEIENPVLPVLRKHRGPSLFDEDGSKNFIKKYKDRAMTGPFVEGEYWYVELKRPYRTVEEKIKGTLRDSKKILMAKGIPSHIAKSVSKKYKLVNNERKIAELVKSNKEFGIYLRGYFEMESLV